MKRRRRDDLAERCSALRDGQRVLFYSDPWCWECSADCQSAKQQRATLRYKGALTLTFCRFCRTRRRLEICAVRVFLVYCKMRIRGLEKKVLDLPPRSRLRIARKIIESVDDFTRKEILAAWSQELERRLNGMDSARMKGMSAAQVMAEARHVLNETRKRPFPRRKSAG